MVLRKCGLSIHDFIDKNCNIFVLKVKKLDEEVIDIGRELKYLWLLLLKTDPLKPRLNDLRLLYNIC